MSSAPSTRYRFDDFVLSPRRRLLIRNGRELPLIPRYFDLLVFLVERRHEAVHKRDIFDRVWNDVVVSDSALSQAIRTIRRTLGDDSREPRFVRTVSRHGYRFAFAGVIEESDSGDSVTVDASVAAAPEIAEPETIELLLDCVTSVARTVDEEEDQREAAELLHAHGTATVLGRLGTRAGHASARALLRDTRWDSPAAADVPIFGAPAPLAVARALVGLRLRRAARLAAVRWAGAATGAGLAGLIAGALGGFLLAIVPGSMASIAVVPVLAVIGGACGALGGAGVGAGLSLAEASARTYRFLALVAGAAFGGGAVGLAVEWIGRWTLAALVGLVVDIGGGGEGLVIGSAAGFGYALATKDARDGMAAPRGPDRLRMALVTAVACGVAALALTLSGRPLVGGTLHAIGRAAHGSQVSLAPLGELIGDPDFGPVSQAIIAAGEGLLFGFGVSLGLTRRPGR